VLKDQQVQLAHKAHKDQQADQDQQEFQVLKV
jgi:hypothetical protein